MEFQIYEHFNMLIFSTNFIFFIIYFRTIILAALHFNWNLNRESLKDAEGGTKLRVTYPKFKEGEGTVRQARVKQNYSMLFSRNRCTEQFCKRNIFSYTYMF